MSSIVCSGGVEVLLGVGEGGGVVGVGGGGGVVGVAEGGGVVGVGAGVVGEGTEAGVVGVAAIAAGGRAVGDEGTPGPDSPPTATMALSSYGPPGAPTMSS